MMARALEFDVVIAEALDRISRDQEDVAAIWKRVEFADCRLFTVSEGLVGELQIGFTGTMSAVFLKNLGDKTRRGQVGRVAAGRIPGGLSYGYEVDTKITGAGTVERGCRRIVPEQADVVRRIFAWRMDGRSATWIVKALNQAKIPGPTGGVWRIPTIAGNRRRGNGILNNELYSGRIVFNRQRFVRDPVTRKRVSRPNPEAQWVIQDVPELRIVDEQVWTIVAAMQKSPEQAAIKHRRSSKRLLSGLIACGVCKGSFIVAGAERWGCGTAKSSGTCTNNRTISTSQLEGRVLGALRDRLLQPDLVAAFIDEYRRATETERATAAALNAKTHNARRKSDQKVQRLTDMMADGIGDYGEMKKRLAVALAERAAFDERLADTKAVPDIIMHPNITDAYRKNVTRLTEALNAPDIQSGEVRQALRNMIELITAEPRPDGRGIDLIVHGRLAQILQIAQNRPDISQDSCMFKGVAGTGFVPKHTIAVARA